MTHPAETQLTGLVLPRGRCQTIGPEAERRLGPDLLLFHQSNRTFRPRDPHPRGGSYRLVRLDGGRIVAGLQVMSPTGRDGVVANVFCRPEDRRRGHASALLAAARSLFADLTLSEDRSPDGAAWADAVGTGDPPLTPSR